MNDLINVAAAFSILITGATAFALGTAFHSMSPERRRRWRRPLLVACGVGMALGAVLWVATLLLTTERYR